MAECLFCDLAHGKTKAHLIIEDSTAVVLLDAFPVNEGHMLVIPKTHIESLEKLDQQTAGHLLTLAIRAGSTAKKALSADSFNIATAPASINHIHLHVVPRYDYDMMGPLADLGNKRELAESLMKELAEKLRKGL